MRLGGLAATALVSAFACTAEVKHEPSRPGDVGTATDAMDDVLALDTWVRDAPGALADLDPMVRPRDTAADAPAFECPQDGVRGPGKHRLFLQGHEAEPDDDGIYPMLHPWRGDGEDGELCDDAMFVNDTNGDGEWQPGEEPRPLGPAELVHGEHFLVGPGAFVEFSIPLCTDITGRVAFYIPNFDVDGSEALHQLLVVGPEGEFLVAEAIDNEAGMSGYNPFVRQLEGNDPEAKPGDRLVLRSTNLNGRTFSVMVWRPPSEYESWITVETE